MFSVLITCKYSFPHKSETQSKTIKLFKSMMKSFVTSQYAAFFEQDGVPELFEALSKSGLLGKIIEAYPKLSESKSMYTRAVESIINFKADPSLLP